VRNDVKLDLLYYYALNL